MFNKVAFEEAVVVDVITVFQKVDAVLSEVCIGFAVGVHLKVVNLLGFIEVERTFMIICFANGLAGSYNV